jgi:basic amino acid/polyamine antiporter, APA family
MLYADEVCLLGAETHNPQRNVPLALLITIAITTAVHALGAVALAGAMPSGDIDPGR